MAKMTEDRLHPGRYQVGQAVYTVRRSGHIIRAGHATASGRYTGGELAVWHEGDREAMETIIADPLAHIIEAGERS